MLRYDPPDGEIFWLLPGGGREPDIVADRVLRDEFAANAIRQLRSQAT